MEINMRPWLSWRKTKNRCMSHWEYPSLVRKWNNPLNLIDLTHWSLSGLIETWKFLARRKPKWKWGDHKKPLSMILNLYTRRIGTIARPKFQCIFCKLVLGLFVGRGKSPNGTHTVLNSRRVSNHASFARPWGPACSPTTRVTPGIHQWTM